MTRIESHCPIWLWAATLIAATVSAPIVRASAEYHVIPCVHRSAMDIEARLSEFLNGADDTHIVADQKRNVLLVRGPAETVDIVREFVRQADRRVKANRTAKMTIRAFPCEATRQADTVAQLRRRFAQVSGIRITADEQTGQVFVLGPAHVHATIEGLLGNTAINTVAAALRDAGNAGRVGQANHGVPSHRLGSVEHPQFVPLRSDARKIEQRVVTLFGKRLTRLPGNPNPVYRLKLSQTSSLDFEFDLRRQGVYMRASDSAGSQFARLVSSLDRAAQHSTRRISVVSVERADGLRLERSIKAWRGRPLPTPTPQVSGENANPDRSAGGGQNQPGQSTINADREQPANANSLRDLGVNVQVETLPELDVIILRGRDRDIENLTEIIQELERLSDETKPEIRVFPLKHARDEAISQLLENIEEELVGGLQGRVTVVPLGKPNGLLLVGWGEAIESMWALIGQLDQPVSPETQIAIFRLKHANATQLQQRIDSFFSDRQGLATAVQVTADARSNSLIVHAVPRDLAEVRRLIQSLDTAASRVISKGRVFALKYALAADLATTLQQAIDAAGGNDNSPSALLELMTVGLDGDAKVQAGMLAGVQVTPNARNNTLLVTGPPDSMELMEALIQQLDSPASSAQIKVFRILNSDASSLVRLLRSLLPSDTGSGGAAPTVNLASAEGETSLAPLRFSVDTRTNSIIATGPPGDLDIIHALLIRLDQSDVSERKNTVYQLKNAPAIDVAAAINEFLRSERIVQDAIPGTTSPFEQIEREVVVVPEPIRNNLIISATPRYYDEIQELVEQLDSEPPQVMIQVLIAEVTLTDTEEFGVELGIQDSVLFDRSLLGDIFTTVNTITTSTPAGIVTDTNEIIQAATNTPGFNFNNLPLGNSGSDRALVDSGTVGGQGLSSFSVGRMNSELGFGGLVLSASSDSVSVLLRALQETSRLEILSRPQIRTLDNQPAYIQVGQRVPRVIGSTINQIGQTNSVALENVGLILGVTPRISPEGTVVMEIDAEKSQLGPELQGVPISVSVDGTVIRSPRIDTTQAQATVSAANGETIILGGLITKSTDQVARKVPILSDIPFLGDLFRYDGYRDRRTELLIILTPQVIRGPEDSERIKQLELARMSWCAAHVHELHGDIGYTLHNSSPVFDVETEVIYPDLHPRGVQPTLMEPSLRDNSSLGPAASQDARPMAALDPHATIPGPTVFPANADQEEPLDGPSPASIDAQPTSYEYSSSRAYLNEFEALDESTVIRRLPQPGGGG